MKRSGLVKKEMPPKESSARTHNVNAPITNAPTTAGLTLVFTQLFYWIDQSSMQASEPNNSLAGRREYIGAPKKFCHPWVATLRCQGLGITLRDDSLGGAVQHDHPVGNAENRRQFVGNDHN